MKSICVYLGSSFGNTLHFSDATVQLGQQIASNNLHLVYGGSSMGLMGLLAKTVMEHGGKVTGIIPESLVAKEKPFSCLDELIVTQTIQERKMLMQQKADAFIVLPGGVGTLEEAFDTWNAIKIDHLNKPFGFLNVEGYFDTLLTFMMHVEQQGFLSPHHAKIPLVQHDPALLIAQLGA